MALIQPNYDADGEAAPPAEVISKQFTLEAALKVVEVVGPKMVHGSRSDDKRIDEQESKLYRSALDTLQNHFGEPRSSYY